MAESKTTPDDTGDAVSVGVISVACSKLFGGGRGVSKFKQSGLRYVKLDTRGTLLIEQNPNKKSEWAKLAREGKRVAWVMRDGAYLARVVDGEVVMVDDAR